MSAPGSSDGSTEDAKKRLFDAALIGDTAVLEQLVAEHRGNKIFYEKNNQGELASFVALRQGHLEFAMKICSYFPRALWVHNRTRGDGLLHMLAKLGRREFFLEGVSLLSEYFQGFSYNKVNDVRREDANELKSYSANGEGMSLLYLAAEKGYVEAAKLLLENTAFSDYVRHLFTFGPPTTGFSPLHVATRNGNYELVQLFLQNQSPHCLDSRGRNPLCYAVLSADRTLVDLLIRDNPRCAETIHDDGLTPLHLAARSGNEEIFKLFVEHGTTRCWTIVTRDRRQNALHIAVEGNMESIISVVVRDHRLTARLSEMINEQDVDGNTPLHLAADKDNEKLEELLLATPRVNGTLTNNEGLTFGQISTSRNKRKQEKMQSKLVKSMKDLRSGLLVMATLIITVTFTAAFTLPGGYKIDQPNEGMATLAGRAGFIVFMVMDTMSMCSSIMATAALSLSPLAISIQAQSIILKGAIGAIALSITFMLAAFTAGVWLVIEWQHRWLAIFTVVITGCTPFGLIILACIMILSRTKEVDEEKGN